MMKRFTAFLTACALGMSMTNARAGVDDDVAIRMEETYRKDQNILVSLQFLDSRGQPIFPKDIAQITVEEGPTQISRENTRRRITIGVNALNRDVESLVNEISSTVDQKVKMPAGYQVVYGGQFENLRKAQARLAITVPAALAIILILFAVFRFFVVSANLPDCHSFAAFSHRWSLGFNFTRHAI